MEEESKIPQEERLDISIGHIVLYAGFEYESSWYHFIFTAIIQ